MSKIGILTFQNAINYGAILQAYGLQEFLRSEGHQVEVINYTNQFFIEFYQYGFSIFHQKGIYHKAKKAYFWLKKPIQMRKGLSKFRKVSKFIDKNLALSKPYSFEQLPKTNSEYDVFVLGSDQVWNAALYDHSTAYFMDFVEPGKTKITYAASLGREYITGFEYEHLKASLPTFNKLSVREKSAQRILSDVLDTRTEVVVDPTLLHPRSFWEELVKQSRLQIKKPYILVYIIQPSPEVIRFANEVAKAENLQIITLTSDRGLDHSKDYSDAGLPDFLSLIFHAKYVVTSSFHGLVFSILFHKEFCYGLAHQIPNNNARIIDMCSDFGLPDRAITTQTAFSFPPIDWEAVDKRIAQRSEESKEFLRAAIKE